MIRATAIFVALAGVLIALNAASVDNEATKAVEEAVASDQFTIVIRDEGPPGGKKRRKPETVATIDFPGYYQFTLKIDRNEGQDRARALKDLNTNNISVSFRNVNDFQKKHVYENALITHIHYTSLGVIMDWSCYDIKFADSDLWNSSYHWLMINQHHGIKEIERFVEIKNISLNLNSEVFYAHLETDKWQLYDIYRTAPSPRGRFIVGIVNESLYGRWGMRSWKYDKRTDLHNLTLNVINVANPYGRDGLNTSQRRLSGGELIKYLKSYGVFNLDSVSRFSYASFEPLAKMFNFSIHLNSSNSWGFKTNGSWDGMIKALITGKADVSGVAAYTNERLDVIDYASVTIWRHRPHFIFRHPLVNETRPTLLRPFSFNVWCCLTTVFLLIVLTYYVINQYEHYSTSLKLDSFFNVLFTNIGAFCQQGIHMQSIKPAGRVIFILVFVVGMFVYQFYSSSSVVSLLRPSVKKIDSFEKIVKSRMQVGIEDSVYLRILVNEIAEVNPLMKEILDYRRSARDQKAEFVLNAEGVDKVMRGNYAFFTDTATSYWFISKLFTESEKCDLAEISITKPNRCSVMLQKKSPYKKLFSYGYIKLLETGFIDRELKRWRSRKPICIYRKWKSKESFVGIKFSDILPAIFLLFIGYLISLLIFIIEHFLSLQ